MALYKQNELNNRDTAPLIEEFLVLKTCLQLFNSI